MVSNIQRYFALKYYAWFHARNLKFLGNKCTQEEGIWINSNLRSSITVPKHTGYFNLIKVRLTYDKSQCELT